MNEKELRAAVERVILSELAKIGEPYVPVMSSNRHCHLCQADVERLFGAGYRLTKLRDLVQPGQFACNERVTIETEKGKLTLRVVGPARDRTQVELSLTDAIKLGLRPPIRMSGELEGSPGCVLSSGNARITLSSGVIVAARHLHMSPEEAQAFDLRDGDVVSLRVEGPRPATLDGFIVRSGAAHRLEAHIDTDEANACALRDGQLCRVIRRKGADVCAPGNTGLAAALGGMLLGGTVTPSVPVRPSVLRPGDKNAYVKELQQNLVTLGYSNVPVDGVYGAKTTAAVKALQRKHALDVDGKAGPKTLAKINELLNAASTPSDPDANG